MPEPVISAVPSYETFTSVDDDSFLDCLLDSNMEKIFRAELQAESRNSKRVPKPRKFVRSKQCLLHTEHLTRHGNRSELPRKLRVNAWKLEASKRLQRNIDFHRSPSWYTAPVYSFSNGVNNPNNNNLSSILTQPVYKKSKKFAIARAKNELEKFMLELQTREITPEDYEKLLELDEKIKAKTADKRVVSALPTRQLSFSSESDSENSEGSSSESSGKDEMCVICMEKFSKGCVVKELPCGHLFHSDCITRWLTKNSQCCPVDQLPFES